MGKNFWVGITLCLSLIIGGAGTARAGGETAPLRPLSVPMAQYLAAHPAAAAALAATQTAATTAPRFVTRAGGKWKNVTPGPKPGGFFNPVLMTDGTVIVQSVDTKHMWKLTPDIHGNYANGTWSAIADLPVINGNQYAPLYHASAVLPDGRLIFMGGEYNHSTHGVWTNLGAIYDPIANTWTPVAAPPRYKLWKLIGDAQSIVLPDGSFMLASCCANPAADALFNPQTLGWTHTGAPTYGQDYQDEQGYSLLPNGEILTVDIWTIFPSATAPTNSELYVPSEGKWIPGPVLPVSVVDQPVCGNYEIGPTVMRDDGTLVQFGGNSGCAAGGSPIDPTTILDTNSMTWTLGPPVPSVCGTDRKTACTLPDAPAAEMPDGSVLFAASSGYGGTPTHFFEYSPNNVITQVSDTLENSRSRGAYTFSFLDLPNGQVLAADFSDQMEVYTPSGAQVDRYAPIITAAPTSVQPGGTYTVAGAQLGGLTQGAGYGDDAQMATNYPIVRFTNVASRHVFYARSFGFSHYSVAPGAYSQASFTVPAGIETGESLMVVIANGVASTPIVVTVQ